MQNNFSKLISLLFSGMLILGIISCKDDSDCCTIIDTDVAIFYKNELGENLINSTIDFQESKIKVYYKNGNEYEYIYDGNLDSPNMHKVYENGEGNSILTVFPSNYYELDNNSQICTGAWLNGVEMNNRFLEVEK